MPVDERGRWIPTGNAEDASVVNRRFQAVNGGALAREMVISGDGVYEIGPFGPHGFALQFGSQDPAEPFTGSFAALVSESLRPGTFAQGSGQMEPPSAPEDFVNEVGVAGLYVITRFAYAAARLRIIVTDYAAGGGTLVAWVL